VSAVSAWHVRNSWSTSWGDSGYIFLQTGYNICGIGTEVQAVIVP